MNAGCWMTSALLIAGLCLAGCAANDPGGARSPGSARGSASESGTGLRGEPIAVSRASYIRTNLLPCGHIPYDDLTLPLNSPDGRYVATQTGIAPSIDTLHATLESTVPLASGIAIYRIDTQPDQSALLVQVATLDQPFVLGRSADAEGFLVEAPQVDGSRWIGKVAWTSGALTWLIRDEYCNAFATLGPGNRLAWVRRGAHSFVFELVVRTPSEQWSIADERMNWLLPVFDATGDGVFALRLGDTGVLEGVYVRGRTETAMRQSMRTIRLSVGARLDAAYQSVVAHPSIVGAPAPVQPTLVFFHPAMLRIGVWRPMRTDRSVTIALAPESFAAAISPDGFTVYAVGDELVARNLDGETRIFPLTDAYFIPRRIADPEWSHLLFAPARNVSGRLAVVRLRLLPVREARE